MGKEEKTQEKFYTICYHLTKWEIAESITDE